jgi:probable phosphoglycerate mutase
MVNNNKITRFGLLRHAPTEWNRQQRIQGQKDSPITREGRKHAARWGRMLKAQSWHRIISSDSGRALETAKIINNFLHIALLLDVRLREQDWGDWTGKTLGDISAEARRGMANPEGSGWRFCPPGGEDRYSVLKRSRLALTEAAKKWSRDTILIVTHEGVIKCLIYHLFDRNFLPSEPRIIQPYHLHWLIHDGEQLRVEGVNAISLSSKFKVQSSRFEI